MHKGSSLKNSTGLRIVGKNAADRIYYGIESLSAPAQQLSSEAEITLQRVEMAPC